MNKVTLLKGDCLKQLKKLKDNSVDSVVTDPPYHLTTWDYQPKKKYKRKKKGFMGKEWDGGDIAFKPDVWEECYRVLKPGGHLLAFSHSRTYHRMGVAVEDAGFEIRDQIMWIYGSGFPKSHNIGKAVDKIQGNQREVVENPYAHKRPNGNAWVESISNSTGPEEKTKGNSPYEGWGTALKPAHEPIVMARKPFKGSVAQNVLEYGTGGINIDECRIGNEERTVPIHSDDKKDDNTLFGLHPTIQHERVATTEGRFPANIIFDEEAGKILDEQSGVSKSPKPYEYGGTKDRSNSITKGFGVGYTDHPNEYGDTGGASRFFYCPKASKKDRNDGCDELEEKTTRGALGLNKVGGNPTGNDKDGNRKSQNIHPTVKPTDLMSYLVRLVTPKGGVVLDPFMGSGSTGKASVREGMDFIGIEREDEYMEIAKSRIEHEKGKHNYRKFFDI